MPLRYLDAPGSAIPLRVVADSSPNSSRSGSSGEHASAPLSVPIVPTSPMGMGGMGVRGSNASMPPSEPRPSSRSSMSALDAQADRPARVQMIVALILGLVLVAIPLYLWRRPRAESVAVASAEAASSSAALADVAPSPAPVVDEAKVTVGEARVIACLDPGPKKTAAEACDHLVEVEKSLAKAIDETSACVPKDAGGGTIAYVVDVSFKKKSASVSTPKDGRSLKNAKVVSACQAAVKAKMHTVALEGVPHQHARYKFTLTATYPGPVKL